MKMWIAREKSGLLQVFRFRPWQGDNMPTEWYHIGGCFPIDSNAFPEVTFENSPMEVELKLIEKLKDIPPAPAVIGNPILNN